MDTRTMRCGVVLAALLALVGCDDGAVLELQLLLPAAPTADISRACTNSEMCVSPGDACVDGRCTYTGPWLAKTEVASPGVFQLLDADGRVPVWIGSSQGFVAPPTLSAEPQWDCISVRGSAEIEELLLRVRYCRISDCTAFSDERAAHFHRIERPFYAGRRTTVRITLPRVPFCANDTDCTGQGTCSPDGFCECSDDAQCASGRCLPGGRCARDTARCDVAGCLGDDGRRPDSASTYCSFRDDPEGVHECERGDADVHYEDPCE